MTYPKMHCWHVKKSKDALVKHGRWREWNNVKSPGRFCPNCGARMDGGDEDVER